MIHFFFHVCCKYPSSRVVAFLFRWECHGLDVVSPTEISCSRSVIVVESGKAIPEVDCVDNLVPHLPLKMYHLLNGLQFDGKTLSGTPLFAVVNYPLIVYNNDSSVLLTLNGKRAGYLRL